MRAAYSDELELALGELGAVYEVRAAPSIGTEDTAARLAQLEAVKRWFTHDWSRIDTKLRTSIVEVISVFLSLFDDNPELKRIFCPPKECYDPELNRDGHYGVPLPAFSELIETGRVVALNFPISANPATARAIGCMLKQDFQRAMLGRIPQMAQNPATHFREALFLCDEYQAFATVGESDPSGDEKFFAFSRQAKCIPIGGDPEHQLLALDFARRKLADVFEPIVFAQLKNAQAIALAYDGTDPLPPTLVFLKPWYLNPNTGYFEQAERGQL